MKLKRKAWIKRQKGSPFWYGVYYVWDDAKKTWNRFSKSTGTENESTAQAIADEWQRLAIDAKERPEIMTRDRALDTVNAIMRLIGYKPIIEQAIWETYAQSWLDMRKRPLHPGEEDRTFEAYKSHIKTFNGWLEKRRKWVIGRLDKNVLQSFYDSLLERGRSSKTAKNIIKTISMVFEIAKAEGLTNTNPVSLVVRDNSKGAGRKKEVFTKEDFNKLIKAAQDWMSEDPDSPADDWMTMVLLGWCTGKRLEDCANAQWQHFDLKGVDKKPPSWELRPKKLRRLNRVEKVPLVEPLLSHLRAKRRKATDLWVCPKLAGRSKLSENFNELIDLAKVEYRIIAALGPEGRTQRSKGFHSFRHTLTTRLNLAGVDKRIAMQIVGHADDKVHDGYTHWNLDALAQAMTQASQIAD